MASRSYSLAVLVASLAAVVVLGCQSAQNTQNAGGAPAGDNAQLEANKEAYRRVVEQAIGQGDTTIVDSLVAATMTDHQTMPGAPSGVAGLKYMIREMHTGFPDLKCTVNDVDAVGDRVWGHVTMTGTQTGPFMGMPPSGKAMSIESFDLVRFENGKGVEHWGVSNDLGMMQQLGAVPSHP